MNIKDINIDGYKCFKHYQAVFSSKANVFIGRNGTGKTTLIHALIKSLSFVFSNDKSLGQDFLSAGNNTLNVRSYDSSDFHFDPNRREYAPEVSIKAEGLFYGRELRWELYKRNNPQAALYPSRYKEAFCTFMASAKIENCLWPVLAYYSDSYPHVYARVMKNVLDVINQDLMPRNFGYYQWDDETSCTSIWEARLCNRLAKMQPLYTPASRLAVAMFAKEQTLSKDSLATDEEYQHLKREHGRLDDAMQTLHDEVNYIERKLISFISHLPKVQSEGFEVDYFFATQSEDGFKLSINFKNGNSSLLQDLPAGYRRLFSIVIDMAYRAYILNQGMESPGVVVIDEIDLHLHPALEQVVLNAFLETFPKFQFFVSTHSAAVISNLDTALKTDTVGERENQVLVMNVGDSSPQVLPNLLGIDYNSVLRDFMDTPSRNEDLRKLEDLYFSYLSMKLDKESQTVFAKIVALVGEDSKILKTLREKAKAYGVH